jgi:hypothetical protein
MELVIYEDSPEYDLWVKILLGLAPVALLVLGLLIYQGVLPSESEAEAKTGAIILFAATAFILLVYWAILPRRYQILEDRIKIVLGGPLSLGIPFGNLETAKETKGLAHFGIGFATSVNRVEIMKRRGTSVLISPGNRDLFLQNLNRALSDWRKGQGYREEKK